MPDFHTIQKSLYAVKAEFKSESAKLLRIKQQMKQNTLEMEAIKRRYNTKSLVYLQSYHSLKQSQESLQTQINKQQKIVTKLQDRMVELSGKFLSWTDPRLNAGRMYDSFPVMLFPVRLETRFKTVGDDPATQKQLWVRIYPDDCLIDSFEETLSQVELKSATIFWREFFRAAKNKDEERAAWRALVSSHGSGRSAWIIKQFRPLNVLSENDTEGDPSLPINSSKGQKDLVLVVIADSNLTTSERTNLEIYWEKIWRAQDNLYLQNEAANELIILFGKTHATSLIEAYKPYNLTEKPPVKTTYEDAKVKVMFVYLPEQDSMQTKLQSWEKPAQANLLPERFVILGYKKENNLWKEILNEIGNPIDAPFSVSPNPAASLESQFHFDEHDNLIVGDELRWVMDFEEAVRRGMGFKLILKPEQVQGFDRLFVLGVRLGSDSDQSKRELETLFNNHYYSSRGFSFLPQGAPTNNTEDGPSAYSREDDADASYDYYFQAKAEFKEVEDWMDKSDGQWFSECLGLDTGWLKKIPHAAGRDQCEARAMNTALWPATLGYFMDTLLQPAFNDDTIYYTRWFFNRFVSGRGMLPAIKIGRQPYGILPTCDFDNIAWIWGNQTISYTYANRFQEAQRSTLFSDWLWKFKGILDNLVEIWKTKSNDVVHVRSELTPDHDAHTSLLNILGLHPSSVEFHQRYANTKNQNHNIADLYLASLPWTDIPANEFHKEAFKFFTFLGYADSSVPQLFDLYWKVETNKLDTIIQDGPLSETEPLRNMTEDKTNYIQWLSEKAKESFDAIRVQKGFPGPYPLLYILLKHALELGYHDAGVRTLDDAQLLNTQSRAELRREPHFFHIEDTNTPLQGKSRYEVLYTPVDRITGKQTLVEYLTSNLKDLSTQGSTRYLWEQLRALEHLATIPTARLERAFVEHLDCCSYRLDAWMTGLINFQLASMRFAGIPEGLGYRKGIYLGAYGWLEDVRPENKILDPVELTDSQLNLIFNEQMPANKNYPSLVEDNKNEGYIHAPSVNHAMTAAILRNGFIAHDNDNQSALLKVNISSERIRLALNIIEGIRNGQNLAALLGYQFERGLHDRYEAAEVDQFIFPLRKVFPLYTRNMKDANDTSLLNDDSVEAVEARNVVNGMHLIRHIKKAIIDNKLYPFGFGSNILPDAQQDQKDAINFEVDRLMDLYDAVADLAIAEGVHQVVLGNYDRAAATLNAYSQATFPPIPDVIQTPRSGIALTHRVAIHFPSLVSPANVTDNPRVRIEPRLNQWLSEVLPAPDHVSCKVSYVNPHDNSTGEHFVTLEQLELSPLDMLYIFNSDNIEARCELEDRIRHYIMMQHVHQNPIPPNAILQISYLLADINHISFFEIAPLIRSLRALLLRSRPLRPTDVVLPVEASVQDTGKIIPNKTGVQSLLTELQRIDIDLQVFLTELKNTFPLEGANIATVLGNIDTYIGSMIGLCKSMSSCGIHQTGFGILLESRSSIYQNLQGLVSDIIRRWQGKLEEYNTLMNALPDDEIELIGELLKAHQLISSSWLDTTNKTSQQIQEEVEDKKELFEFKKAQFESFSVSTETQLSQALTNFTALLYATPAYRDFDLVPAPLEDIQKPILIQAEDIYTRVKQLDVHLKKCISTVDSKLSQFDDEADSDKRVQLLSEAVKFVCGEEFLLIPGFEVSERQGSEWTNAFAQRESLLDYQKNEILNPFPVDDWLYGIARVREKMQHLENVIFLTDAFQTSLPELQPIQFPFEANAAWLAMEFPEGFLASRKNESLLYTALYPGNFMMNDPQYGLLIDEWTEVIPAPTETTGIAFHFDKPNCEPPQSILLATPTQFKGNWMWNDLVNSLHSTLDRAKIRAVEPEHLDETELSVFMPATIFATTWRPITIATDLSLANNYVNEVSNEK